MKYVSLEMVCDILDSQRVPITASERTKGDYPYYGANGVQDYVADFIFDDELVLLAEDGGNFGSKDRPIAYRVSGKCWVNNHAHVLKPKKCIDVDYLCYSLMFYDTTGIVNGATRQKLTQAAMRQMTIPMVSMDEQKEIVLKLNKVENLISQRKEQLNKLDELVKSRFIELFGDPVNNPMGWHVADFSEYITFLTSGSRGWAQYFSDNGEYFITIKNVKNCRITLDNVQHIVPPDNAEAKRTRVKEGDLLISITADLGRTGVVSKEIADHGGYINHHLTCIRLDQSRIRPLYAAYFLESDAGKNQFQAKNQNGVKAGLNFNAINSLKLLVPPIEVQDAFISFVEQTDKLKFDTKQALEKLEILKKSLMQQYFG